MEAAAEEQQPEAEIQIDYTKYSVNNALSMSTKISLSSFLNPPRCLSTDEGLPKDWRGLAHLVGLSNGDVAITEKDPTNRVLELWNEKAKNTCTVATLKQYLCELDRWDIVDDTKTMIDDDIHRYIRLQSDSANPAPKSSAAHTAQILTRHDANRFSNGLDAQHYDAFVLFADADIAFATKLIAKLEDVYNLKLCTKNRDLIGGHVFEHSVIMKLISERCNKLVIVVTQAFLECPLYSFFVNYSLALGIEQQLNKIVPLRLGHCEMPMELSYYVMLDYTRDDIFNNFWEKLYYSVRTASPTVISRRATSVSPAQNRPVIRPRPKSATYVITDDELSEKENCNKDHHHVQFDSSATQQQPLNGDVVTNGGDNISQKSIKSRFLKPFKKIWINNKPRKQKIAI